MKRLILTVFLILAFFLGGLGGCSFVPLSVRGVEQKVEVEYLVIKNTTDCMTVDFVVYEIEEGKAPLAVAGNTVSPGERMELKLPPGKYCVAMVAKKDGVVVDKKVTCGVLPDPNIPENAKATIVIGCSTCKKTEA